MSYKIRILFLFLIIFNTTIAQNAIKREFRGVWVASIGNIDFPSRQGMDNEDFKKEFIQLLSYFKNLGFNAIVFQVRPAGDAFYPSRLVPFSKYLTGKQGKAPEGDFDPLAFMVEATHHYSMEFHAWLNPYRASVDLDLTALDNTHFLKQHPDWCIKYGSKWYFNPALPEVQQHLNEVVAEIVQNYDIDAIHFDDYFYPYKEKGENFADTADYIKLGTGFENIEDWRRNNVNNLIFQISNTIKAIKPNVELGVSPFSVWRNKDKDPLYGSDTNGANSCYDDLFADVRRWAQEGWVDYLAPQLYFHIGFDKVDYAKILDWWANNSFGKKLYIGQGAYRIGSDKAAPEWSNAGELGKQMRLNRSHPEYQGSIFFSARSLFKNPLGVADSLRTNYYNETALVPKILSREVSVIDGLQTTKDKKNTQSENNDKKALRELAPVIPTLLSIEDNYSFPKIKWDYLKGNAQKPYYFAVYRSQRSSFTDFKLVGLTAFDGNELEFVDKSAKPGKVYSYSITALNRRHAESFISNSITIKKTSKTIKTKRFLGFFWY